MNRRELLAIAASALPAFAVPAETVPGRVRMGICTTSYMTVWRPKDSLEFLEHCATLGAGGVQAALSSLDPAYIARFRERAEKLGMYYEGMVSMPGADTAPFERAIAGAKAAGAQVVRSGCLSGRRYEKFATKAAWDEFVAASMASIERALPVLEKHKMTLGLENHKDWTTEEMLALLRKHSSEYLGVNLDTGNNISLLDDPLETVRALAPYTVGTHLKDMGVAEYRDGFLLSELPLGAGILNMNEIVSIIRKARPNTRLTLEMITRDPLPVPCLTDKYWVTMEGRSGQALARTLSMVRRDAKPLPHVTGTHEEQLRSEEDNVRRSLDWARQNGC